VLWCLQLSNRLVYNLPNTLNLDCCCVIEGLCKVLLERKNFNVTVYHKSHTDSVSNTQYAELVETCGSFSKYCVAYQNSRWSVISTILLVLASASASASLSQTTTTGTKVKLFSNRAQNCDFLDEILNELDISTTDGLTLLINATHSVVSNATTNVPQEQLESWKLKLSTIIDVSWNSCCSGANINVIATSALVNLAFDPVVIQTLDISDSKEFFAKLYKLGSDGRSYLLQLMLFQLSKVWLQYPEIGLHFVDEVVNMLLHKEPPHIDNSCVNLEHIDSSTVLRFLMLECLELIQNKSIEANEDKSKRVFLQLLVRNLIKKSCNKKYVPSAMIGTETFGEKLRMWQALCVLSHSVDKNLLLDIVDDYFNILQHISAHGIRTCVEIFGAKMALLYPEVMLPRVIKNLKEYNISQQVLASNFIILGYLFEEHIEIMKNKEEEMQEILDVMMPWTICAAGLPRTISIYLMHKMIPYIIESQTEVGTEKLQSEHYLTKLHKHIMNNKDTKKVIIRTKTFFNEYNIKNKCTLLGLQSIGTDHTGEIMPDHLLTAMGEVLRQNLTDQEFENIGSVKSFNVRFSPPLPLSIPSSEFLNETLQTKIVPYDELQLTLCDENTSRSRNGQGQSRNSFVVCASLISSTINLAGLARTSEIFAMEELVLGDLSVVQSETFQGIAVSAEQWIPISECKPEDLVVYLQNMKEKGYDVIALEQTDSSITLGDVNNPLPKKCVLVLGKEKEGVPVEILQLCTQTVEIKQFGVIRSLNVHVAASIIMYELTKTNTVGEEVK
jgi:tRNA guanosine-2'-O-methyltransferase